MRKLFTAAILAGLVVSSAMPQANAATTRILVQTGKHAAVGTVACTFTCPYWLDVLNDGSTGFQACEQPVVAAGVVSHRDTVQGTPKNAAGVFANLVVYVITPEVDWDSFICAKPTSGNNGEMLASGANNVGDPCDGLLGPGDPTGMGCLERSNIPVAPGDKYVFRAYNWSDNFDAPWNLTWNRVT